MHLAANFVLPNEFGLYEALRIELAEGENRSIISSIDDD